MSGYTVSQLIERLSKIDDQNARVEYSFPVGEGYARDYDQKIITEVLYLTNNRSGNKVILS